MKPRSHKKPMCKPNAKVAITKCQSCIYKVQKLQLLKEEERDRLLLNPNYLQDKDKDKGTKSFLNSDSDSDCTCLVFRS